MFNKISVFAFFFKFYGTQKIDFELISNISGSPFSTTVIDPSAIRMQGDGLSQCIRVDKSVSLAVNTDNAGEHEFEFVVLGEFDRNAQNTFQSFPRVSGNLALFACFCCVLSLPCLFCVLISRALFSISHFHFI